MVFVYIKFWVLFFVFVDFFNDSPFVIILNLIEIVFSLTFGGFLFIHFYSFFLPISVLVAMLRAYLRDCHLLILKNLFS